MKKIYLLLLLSVGCATTSKPAPLTTFVEKPKASLVAIGLTAESADTEVDEVQVVSANETYQLDLSEFPTLAVPGAKVFVIELPEGRYAIRGFADGSMLFQLDNDSIENMRFPVAPGTVTYIGTYDVDRPTFRRVNIRKTSVIAGDSTVRSELLKSLPKHKFVHAL